MISDHKSKILIKVYLVVLMQIMKEMASAIFLITHAKTMVTARLLVFANPA